MGSSSASGKKTTTTIKAGRGTEMTRLRLSVTPESRDTSLVHAQDKEHYDSTLRRPECRDLSDRGRGSDPIGYYDQEENEQMLKVEKGIIL